MNTSILLLILALIGIGSYLLGSRRAVVLSGGRPSSMHSRAGYHGSYAVVWAVLPAAFILCAWLVISPCSSHRRCAVISPRTCGRNPKRSRA